MGHKADGSEQKLQRIKWSKISDGVFWGVAPCGLAYRIERANKVEGVQHWDLKEFPNEDAEVFEYVDTGPFRGMKRTAAFEATCAAVNRAREAAEVA